MDVVALRELLVGSGSPVSELTLKVLVTGPVETALTTMVMVARAPLVSVPRLQRMVPLSLVHVPIVLIAETKLSCGGRASVAMASAAAYGPRLVTLSV